MANAHQLLMSLEWPAVTNARANGGEFGVGCLGLQQMMLLRA